jgi:hypothetical protein
MLSSHFDESVMGSRVWEEPMAYEECESPLIAPRAANSHR